MESVIPDLESLSQQIMSADRPKKPKMLVVDDEPDNLDLLYRTFRREFQVLKADSGIQALEILAQEGEVAVIISDQRMPQMKGTEFLSRTVPQFPNTVRIILTGFTDVEDLVEAINSGQVYKYITKPWDPSELKDVVQKATETYDLQKHRLEDLRRAEAQADLMTTIIEVSSQATSLETCLTPIASAFGKNFDADVCFLGLVEGTEVSATQGVYGADSPLTDLGKDPLVQMAIASKVVQGCLSIPESESLASFAPYQALGLLAHIVAPVSFREQVMAVLSLRWSRPCQVTQEELSLIQLSAQQVALALACTTRYVDS